MFNSKVAVSQKIETATSLNINFCITAGTDYKQIINITLMNILANEKEIQGNIPTIN